MVKIFASQRRSSRQTSSANTNNQHANGSNTKDQKDLQQTQTPLQSQPLPQLEQGGSKKQYNTNGGSFNAPKRNVSAGSLANISKDDQIVAATLSNADSTTSIERLNHASMVSSFGNVSLDQYAASPDGPLSGGKASLIGVNGSNAGAVASFADARPPKTHHRLKSPRAAHGSSAKEIPETHSGTYHMKEPIFNDGTSPVAVESPRSPRHALYQLSPFEHKDSPTQQQERNATNRRAAVKAAKQKKEKDKKKGAGKNKVTRNVELEHLKASNIGVVAEGLGKRIPEDLMDADGQYDVMVLFGFFSEIVHAMSERVAELELRHETVKRKSQQTELDLRGKIEGLDSKIQAFEETEKHRHQSLAVTLEENYRSIGKVDGRLDVVLAIQRTQGMSNGVKQILWRLADGFLALVWFSVQYLFIIPYSWFKGLGNTRR